MVTKVYKLALLVSIIAIVGFAYYTYKNYKEYQQDDDLVKHSELVKQTIHEIGSSIQDARMAAIGVIATNDTSLVPIYRKYSGDLVQELHFLDSLVRDNPKQQKNVGELRGWISQYSYLADSILKKGSFSPLDKMRVTRMISQRATLSDSISKKLRIMRADENQYLVFRKNQRKSSKTFAPLTILFFTLCAAVIIGILFNRIFDLLRKSKLYSKELKEKLQILNEEISKREKIEKSLLGVLNSSPNGILEFTVLRNKEGEPIDFVYATLNHKAEEFMSKKEHEVLGKKLSETYPLLKNSESLSMFKDVVRKEKQDTIIEYFTGNGLDYYFRITATYYTDGIVVTFSDVTEEKKNELELYNKTEDLKRSNEELERFAYVASHDLQEPLRKVRAFGDRLLTKFGDTLPDPGPDYISRMQKAATRMQTLIDDLLQFSRVSRNKREFNPVNLNEVLEEIQEDMEDFFKENELEIKTEQLPLVYGNFTQLKQLFQNLISNSVKFSKPNQHPCVSISAQKIAPEEAGMNEDIVEECWKLVFKDNGIGFDSKYSTQIFTIFQRLHGREAYKGTGIGLAICERIVQNHLGFIKAESTEGEGAAFIIYLPTNKNLNHIEHDGEN